MIMNGSGCKNCPVKPCGTTSYRGSWCAAARAKFGLGDLQTNADRIRAMSDEELAEFICSRCHFQDIDNTMCGAIISCDGNCLEWLKQPAEEG
jgi:hypothetical protein